MYYILISGILSGFRLIMYAKFQLSRFLDFVVTALTNKPTNIVFYIYDE
jgi:hypothetical protein